jgi:hypothetical protein
LIFELGQQPGHILGVLGHRGRQHGPDLRDVGAPRAQHQTQMGFLEARAQHRTGLDEPLAPRHQRRQSRIVGRVDVVRVGHR